MTIDRRAHFDLVNRAAAGKLTDVERAALAVLLERLLVAVELTEEEGPAAGWWERVDEAFRTLTVAEVATPQQRSRAGGAEVRTLRAR